MRDTVTRLYRKRNPLFYLPFDLYKGRFEEKFNCDYETFLTELPYRFYRILSICNRELTGCKSAQTASIGPDHATKCLELVTCLTKEKSKKREKGFVRHACLILGVIKVRKLRLFLSKKNIHHKNRTRSWEGNSTLN